MLNCLMFVWIEYQPMFPKRALSFSDNVSFSFWSMIWSSSLASVIVQCASCGTKQRERWCISYLTRPWNEFSETVVCISYFQIIEMYTYVFVYIFVFSKKNTLQDSYTNTHLLSSAAIVLIKNECVSYRCEKKSAFYEGGDCCLWADLKL